uniref:Uncharacterized protein n=1 Tax=Amphimedon queenslandica TaxID=400682 RepID=A0A1X7VXL9_AMPQE
MRQSQEIHTRRQLPCSVISSSLTFLGIEIDTIKRELRLPQEKLIRLQREWVGKKAATKHDIQVIIGLLNDAAQVVPAGRSFIRNLIDDMSPLRKAYYFSRLNLGSGTPQGTKCAPKEEASINPL